MKFKNITVYGLEESIIASGYPHLIGEPDDINPFSDTGQYLYGNGDKSKDIIRAEKLSNTPAGSGHSCYRKGIIVQFDMLYPQYFTPQLQRYHWIEIISSQSKMHSLTKIKDIKDSCNKYVLDIIIDVVNKLIEDYNNSDIQYPYSIDGGYATCNSKEELFHYIISNLPMGYMLWMRVSTNYEQLSTIYRQRKHHKLYDWKEFCKFIEELPMSNLITGK